MSISFNRNAKGVSNNIYIPYERLVTEPRGGLEDLDSEVSGFLRTWLSYSKSMKEISRKLFRSCSWKTYSKLSTILAPISAFFCGLYLGCLAFVWIWILRPVQVISRMQCHILRQFWLVCIMPVMEVWRYSLGTSSVNISSLDTQLRGVRVERRHCMRMAGASPKMYEQHFKMVNESKIMQQYQAKNTTKLTFR